MGGMGDSDFMARYCIWGDLDHVELSVPNLTSPLASTPR